MGLEVNQERKPFDQAKGSVYQVEIPFP